MKKEKKPHTVNDITYAFHQREYLFPDPFICDVFKIYPIIAIEYTLYNSDYSKRILDLSENGISRVFPSYTSHRRNFM